VADIAFYEAYFVIYDSAKKAGRVGLRVSETDGKAYVAAADTAARAATKVGLLLDSVADMVLDPATSEYKHGLDTGFLNSNFAFPPASDQNFRSNKIKIDYATTNNGLPANGSFSIPMRDPAQYAMESNGVNIDIIAGATTEVENLIAQIVDTLLSAYGTGVGSVTEMTVNDV